MIRELVQFDPLKTATPHILSSTPKKIAQPSSKASQELILDLNDTLDDLISKYGNERGIGLAANQIGVSLSVAVVDIEGTRHVLINPTITKQSKKLRLFRIGCFSLYKYRGLVHYPESVTVSYIGVHGEKKELSLTGDSALVAQHELDHLNGLVVFDRLPNKRDDLFIPRETLYPTKRIRVKNYGIFLAIKKKLGLPFKQQTTPQYYSALFRDSVDWKDYVASHVEKRIELMQLLGSRLPDHAKILEAGCGSSALSVFLSTRGHDVTCIDIDEDMLEMAKRCNVAFGGNAKYELQDLFRLKYKSDNFDIVYSHGVLEELGDEKRIVDAINESLRVGRVFIFSVPTIWDRSNNLLGEEELRTVGRWRRIIEKSDGKVTSTTGCFPFHPRLRRLNKLLNNGLLSTAPVVLFAVDRK